MKDPFRTNQELIEENASLKQKIQELEQTESELKYVEEPSSGSEQRFRKIFEEAPLGILITSPSFVFEKANPAFCHMVGYSADELRSMTFADITHPDHLTQDMEHVKKVGRGEISFYQTEKRYIHKSGKVLWGNLIVSSIHDDHGALQYYLAMVIDITEQKKAVELLLEANNEYQELTESISDVFFAMDKNLRYTHWNKASEELTGIPAEKALGKSLVEVYPDNEAREKVSDLFLLTIETKKPQHLTINHPGNERIVHEISSYPTMEGVSVFVKDITERKRDEEKLREMEERLRDILFSIADWVWEVDENGVYTYSSQKGFDLFGESRGDIIGKTLFDFMPPDEAKRVAAIFSEIVANKAPIKDLENWNIGRNGERICLLTNGVPILDEEGNLKGYRGIDKDITEQKKVKEVLQESQRQREAILNNIPDIAWLKDKENRYIAANEPFSKSCGFKIEDLVGKTDFDFWPRDLAEKYIADDQEVMESGKRKRFEEPLINFEGNILWIETIKTPIYDEHGNVVGSAGIARDITEKRQSEGALQESMERLRKAFSAIIQVMVSAVEVRDPYTAGHQIRSANLARVIATEMGLPQEKIEGLRMAGSIHDIGKLSIPAEILSKPTKLSEIEFSLIKEHARRGFEMLKDVESPWPLAEIVYQHHERMDGSGYPRNMRGEQIIMEARILAVADVVESMASHRPYRPALGTETALQEIENNRGILYDTVVVDACLRIFREKRFQFL